MKTKAFFVYVALGIAFAAVSLWVILSRGKNAKAIRAKYRLGGAMIATWAILSAASCDGPGPFVTCYDPVMPPNQVNISNKNYEDTQLNAGDILLVQVYEPTYDTYLIRIFTKDKNPRRLLQSESFDVEDKSQYAAVFELQLAETDYTGEAIVEVYGVATEDGKEVETLVESRSIVIY